MAEYPKGCLDAIRPDDWFLLIGASERAAVEFDFARSVLADLAETVDKIGTFELLWDLHRTDLGNGDAEMPVTTTGEASKRWVHSSSAWLQPQRRRGMIETTNPEADFPDAH